MPYYVVWKQGGPYPVGKYFVGNPATGLKQAEWRKEDEDDKPRLLPKFGVIVIPYNTLAPFLKELTNANTGSFRDPRDR